MMMFSKNQGIARRLFFWLACGLACAPVVGAAASVADSDPLVIPQPKSLQPGTGIFIWPRDARWTEVPKDVPSRREQDDRTQRKCQCLLGSVRCHMLKQ